MIHFYRRQAVAVRVTFCRQMPAELAFLGCHTLFTGEYARCLFVPHLVDGQRRTALLIGCGDAPQLGFHEAKELCAAAAKALRDAGVQQCVLETRLFWHGLQQETLMAVVLGLVLGEYQFSLTRQLPEDITHTEYLLDDIPEDAPREALLEAAMHVARGTVFVRDMVNRPGNLLHPMDFERMTLRFLDSLPIEEKLLVFGQLKAEGLNLLAGVGASSEFPPCLLILRYRGAAPGAPVTALVGKGVTCDTGGYCLKKPDSMSGIKGDMAGAAAVVGALYALAANRVPVNVTACLPLCENRISSSAILPGDVLTACDGTTVEVLNTDAEGRLILGDAVAYAVQKEQAARVVDIATLTGAVWAALGYTISGVLCDDEPLYASLARASKHCAERHLRLPFGPEHEKMLESTVADLKNTGADCCGAITAGLFVRRFAKGLPWLHLDIAGTAWAKPPQYAFEQPGATGVGVSLLYELLRGESASSQT